MNPEEKRTAREREITDLCSELNKAGADPQWTKKNLRNFINREFQVADGIDSLSFESIDRLEQLLRTGATADPD